MSHAIGMLPTDQEIINRLSQTQYPPYSPTIEELVIRNSDALLAETKLPPANPKQHYGDKKLPLALVPFSFVAHVCVALFEGKEKYGLVNWRASKVEAMTYVSALARHMHKWVNGERVDPVTKVHHLANAAACLAILLDAELNGSLIDNRPQACENTARMITELESVLENLKVLYADQNPKHYYMKEGS